MPCALRGPLRASDPLPNAGDDDGGIPEEVAAGISPDLAAWLALGAERDERPSLYDAASGDDDASRGVPEGLQVADVGWYLDAEALAAYLGAPPITVDCATRLAMRNDYAYAFVSSASTEADVASALASERPLRIARFGGGFTLGALRDAVSRADERAADAHFRFSPRLRAAAGAYKASMGGGPYAVLHWRSETLVARKDAKVDGAFKACASEVLDAAPADVPSLLVTDMPHDFALPLWTSFARKLDRGHASTARAPISKEGVPR